MIELIELFKGVNIFEKDFGLAFILAFFTTVLVVYAIFIYYFYRFLAKKNIFEIDLAQYNQYSNPGLVKFFAIVFYFLEYILFLPIIIFFWFTVLSILVLLMAEGIDTRTILLISAALIASVRVTSYVSENLSRDLAKVLPFTLVAVAITKQGFFNVESFLIRITEIPSLFSNIIYYLVFIAVIELVMRVAESVTKLFKKEPEEDEEDKN